MSEPLIHLAWSAIPPEQLNPLLSRQFVSGAQAMLSRIQLQKGCVVPWHSHPNEQIVFILSGILRFTVGEEGSEKHVYDVHGGETLVIPGNALIFRQAGPQAGTVDQDGKVTLKKVTIGRDLGTTLEITEGLTADDQVIINPSDSLGDGQIVNVTTNEKKAP